MTENNYPDLNEDLTNEINTLSEEINTDDDLGRLIYDSLLQTFGDNDISVSEDLIAKTMARINALPKAAGAEDEQEIADADKDIAKEIPSADTVKETPVVNIAAERAKKRNRIIKIAATAAAGLVIGIVGLQLMTSSGFKKDTADSAKSTATTYGGGVSMSASTASDYGSEAMDTQPIYSLSASQTEGYLEDDMANAEEPMANGTAVPKKEYATTDVITVFEGGDETGDVAADSISKAGETDRMADGTLNDTPGTEEHTTVIAQGENGFTMDDLPEGSVYIMEFSENEEPEKYEAIKEIAENIKANNFRTSHPAENPLLVITNNAADGSCEVYGFGSTVFTEVLYPNEDRLVSAETNYSVPEMSTYIEEIINEYGEE